MTSVSGAAELRRRVLWLAYLSGGFGLAMGAQVGFLVPLRARELGAGFDSIGLIIGVGALVPAVLSVASGAVIDRLGPKNAYVLGAGASALLSLLYFIPTNFWWFVALQGVSGIGRNLGWVASQAYITSLGAPEQRPALTGRFSFFASTGQMVAPILVGAAAQLVGFRWAFLVPAVYATCCAVMGLFLTETRGEDHASTRAAQGLGVRSAVGLVAIRGIQVALLLTFSRLWIHTMYATFLPVFLVDSGFEPGLVGTVMATSGLVAALVAPTAGVWTRLLSQHSAAVLGLLCGAGALVLAPHVAVLPVVYLVPMLIGVGSGLSLPLLLSIVTSAAPASKRGVALGLRAMVNQVASTTSPVLVGPLITVLGMTLGFTTGGLLVAVLLGGARLLSALDRREQANSAVAP